MVLGDADRRGIAALLDSLEEPVTVRLDLGASESNVTLVAGGGREVDPSETTRALLEELCALSGLVRLEVHEHPGRGQYPRTTVGERVAFVGTPWGYEITSLAHGIAAAGRTASGLGAGSLATLARIERDVALEVWVTPTCTRCPPAVLLAYRCALAHPRVRATAVETSEFPERAGRLGVSSVPAIAVDGRLAWSGGTSEETFVRRLVDAATGPAGGPRARD